jgi:tetratricopeptide (TPR) repeat protein
MHFARRERDPREPGWFPGVRRERSPGRPTPRATALRMPVVLVLALLLDACQRRSEGEPRATVSALVTSGQALIRPGARWRYLDDGSNPGPSWATPGFDQRRWKVGSAPLGFGLGNEATVVSFGPDPASKPVTTFFRGEFQLPDVSVVERLLLQIVHDDGAAVYLNGVEIYRSNLPAGPLSPDRLAETADNGALPKERVLEPAMFSSILRMGRNVVAVEVHQVDRASPELTFDLALSANPAVVVTRGPYLQMGAPTAATLRWRTNLTARGRVTFGTMGAGGTMQLVDESVPTTEHEVRLIGLTPATRYDYTLGTRAGPLVGGDGEHYFVTPPLPGTAKATRIWVIGDSGTADANAAAVYRAYRQFTGRRHTDLWLMLGDNAYLWGTDQQYQAAVFDFYPHLLRQVFLWSAIGNHETYYGGPPEQSPYLANFTLPTRGEVGGLASGTELYYSFDHGNIHFVALDSMVSSRAPGAAMWTWLQADLAATDKTWLIAFWHHPPYTRGSHDSDNANALDGELVDMRERALPILESYGVDLVLGGHSHIYERSYLLSGHYGASTTLDQSMKRDHGDGQRDGAGAYRKTASARGGNDGTVYVVAGSSGQVTPQLVPGVHPAMLVTLLQLGSLVIDVEGNQLSAVFLREDGTIEDRFAMEKNAAAAAAAPAVPTDLRALTGPENTALLTWSHDGRDETGFSVERASADGRFLIVAEPGANATEFTDRDVALGQLYRYQVRASNGAGVSPPSNVVELRVGDAPPLGPTPSLPGEPVRTGGGGGLACAYGRSDGGWPGGLLALAALLALARRRRSAVLVAPASPPPARPPTGHTLIMMMLALLLGAGTARAHGSAQERLAAVQAEIAAHPDSGRLHLQRGELLRELGRPDEALADLIRAARLEPGLPAVDRLTAQLLLARGDREPARGALDRALQRDPDDVEALRLRARLATEAGRPAAAARDLQRRLPRLGDTATPDDHLLLVRALRAAGQPAAAARSLERASACFGRLVTLELEAIDLAEQRGRHDEALARIDAFAATVARKEPWLVRRAAILAAAGRRAAARAAYQAALDAITRLPPPTQSTRAMLALQAQARAGLGGR